MYTSENKKVQTDAISERTQERWIEWSSKNFFQQMICITSVPSGDVYVYKSMSVQIGLHGVASDKVVPDLCIPYPPA